jgi:pectate lyase
MARNRDNVRIFQDISADFRDRSGALRHHSAPMRHHSFGSFAFFAVAAVGITGLWGCGDTASSNPGPAGSAGSDPLGTSGAPSNGGGAPSSAGTAAMNAGSGNSSAGTASAGAASAGASSGGVASGGGAGAGHGGSAGSGPIPSCSQPPTLAAVTGWASVSGLGTTSTTGGGNAAPQTVKTLDAFKKAVAGDAPAVVYLDAVLPPAGIAIGSNKTIVGLCGAEIHGHVGLSHSVNVIVANLKIVGYGVGDCAKDPDFDAAVGCSSGADAVSISSASHHVWFDHCDISDGTDGNLDINAGSDFVTISWTKFHYTPRTDSVGNDSTGASGHRFSNLIGSGDNVAEDVGHLNVTFHHDFWAENVNQRMPRSRNGKIHVVNNLYAAPGNSYCTNSGFQTHLLVENNVYDGVKNPLSPDANGDMLARNNVFKGTTGTTTANGTGFTPPYAYTPEATDSLAAQIMTGVGPH